MKNILYLLILFILPISNSYSQKFKTKFVIVVIVDGPRYSETWGDSLHRYIPYMSKEISKSGVICDSFFNDKLTYTSSGHTAITTGYSQELENVKGTQLPDHPSFMQYYLQKTGKTKDAVCLITSKDKLAILGNCNDSTFHNKFLPFIDSGKSGWGTGHREDKETFKNVISALNTKRPDILFVNFKEPDISGHRKDWNGYLKGIQETDSLVWELWKFIKSDSYYKNKTSFFVTNDHGRHLDSVKQGFAEHGNCNCEGCQHLNFFALGPDFKKNTICHTYYNQMDLTATIAELLDLEMPLCQGKVMTDIFRNYKKKD